MQNICKLKYKFDGSYLKIIKEFFIAVPNSLVIATSYIEIKNYI